MQRKLTWLLMLGGILAAGCFMAMAQDKDPAINDKIKLEKMIVEADRFKVVASKPAFGKLVKGAPYSATGTTETVQTLSDGNQIIRKNETTFYRDSEGRTRMEQTLGTIGKWTADGIPSQRININDPVTGFYYDLDPQTQTALKSGGGNKGQLIEMKQNLELMRKIEAEKVAIAKTVKPPELVEDLDKQKREIMMKRAAAPKETKPWELEEGVSGDPRRKIDNLGKQMIEGVEVVGTRSTFTISAGEVGNVLPIEVIEETWYSPELQVMVMTKYRDPRMGETTYRLTNLNRNEPDRTLFEVPAGYAVKENPMLFKIKDDKEED